jgi:hypothetical protein
MADEKILSNRVKISKQTTQNNKQGALIINPNRVVVDNPDGTTYVKDRYVKQEDLMIYSSLKVIKHGERGVVVNANGTKSENLVSESLFINFLNPIKNKNGGKQTFKNKLTADWTDFFTSESSQDDTNKSYIFDPESFGITDIDISINASYLPKITIHFTDINGKMLFERGNDVNNPYNIFFTYPYPKFLLTYKGYYGKAMEIPLVLLKSNTKFDPNTGNYNIVAEFQSEIFSLLNNFLIIYAYVAPYMFLMDDGNYLGSKILSQLYKKQNDEIRANIKDDVTFAKYNISGDPTLFDLSRAILKIPSTAVKSTNDTDETSKINDKILNTKYKIELSNRGVREYFDNQNTDGFNIGEKSPNEFTARLQTLNDSIATIKEIPIEGLSASILKSLNNDLKIKNNPKYGYFGFSIEKLINLSVFQIINDEYSLELYDLIISHVLSELNLAQETNQEKYIEDQIKDIGVILGYEPNLNNILRIISNNMQTFLILMEITAKNAITQLKQNNTRVSKHRVSTDYLNNNKKELFTPFPNYYYTYKEIVNGESLDRHLLAYPGRDYGNKEWHEVVFIDEIYKATGVINRIANPTKKNGIPKKETGLITLFGLGDTDLSVYNDKTTVNSIFGELFTKVSLFSNYSGFLYRGLNESALNNIITSIVNFESDFIDRLVLKDMSDTAQFYITESFSKIGNITNKKTPYGSFAYNFIKLDGDTTGFNNFIANVKSEINMYGTRYDAPGNKVLFDRTVANTKNSIVVGNRSLYNAISFNDITSPLNYSINGGEKVFPLTEYQDLSSNVNFFNNNSSLLSDITSQLLEVDNKNIDNNPFQGFIEKLNEKLKNIPINVNLTTSINSGSGVVPTLTFNTSIKDDDLFPIIVAPINNALTYNNL